MGDLNRCEFIGRLAADPEVHVTKGGKAVVNFRLAVNSHWKNRQTGEREKHTEYIPFEAWGSVGQNAQRLLTKGREIWIEGRMKTRRWEKVEGDGDFRYSTTIVCEQFQLLGPRPASATAETVEPEDGIDEMLEAGDADPEEDEIPF